MENAIITKDNYDVFIIDGKTYDYKTDKLIDRIQGNFPQYNEVTWYKKEDGELYMWIWNPCVFPNTKIYHGCTKDDLKEWRKLEYAGKCNWYPSGKDTIYIKFLIKSARESLKNGKMDENDYIQYVAALTKNYNLRYAIYPHKWIESYLTEGEKP